MHEYTDTIGGVFSFGDWEVIPYNHWKRDMEWMVLIVDPPSAGFFVPVRAYSPREAAQEAIRQFTTWSLDDD